MMTMLFTDHELSEFSRMANAAYACGRNDVGHKFSALSACGKGVEYPLATFDALKSEYRAWLVFNEYPK